jgi:hypothetical protein
MLSDERIEEIANEVAAPVSRYLPYWRTSVDFARAIEAAVLPKGYVLVPKELPIEFAAWVCREVPSGTFINDPHWWAPRLYKAMLVAAPKPTQSCDMGELCLGCSPRNTDGSCPDAAQAEGQEPVKDGPVARVDANDDGYWADILPDRSVKVGQLLYTHPQPDLTAEVERLRNLSACEACIEIPSVVEYVAQCEKQEPVKDEPVAWCVAYDDPRMGRIHSNPSMHKPELEALIGRAGNQLVLVPLYTRPQPENTLWQTTAKSLGAEVDNITAEVERLRQICRDAYEVWAGSNGIPEPITCVEAYMLQLLIQMRDEVKRGLK